MRKIIPFIIALALITQSCEKYHSNSGSMQILRTYGTVNQVGDTLVYQSNNFEALNELEIRAILTMKNVTNVKLKK